MNRVVIHRQEKTGYIKPELHGQFIEFLGTCIYDGIWVGEYSKIPNYRGLRKDFVDAMKELHPPVIRWPGGCFADIYHWRDGIGERENRPVTYNENFGTCCLDTNQFGTHEFMELCRLVDAKPWLNINMMTGTPAEMREWMEYCNREEKTSLAAERKENGGKEAFKVKYWGLGNEMWCGGGNATPECYADQYRQFASAIPAFYSNAGKDEEKIVKIASGPDGNKPKERVKWTQNLFRSFAEFRQPPLDALDLHFYNWNLEKAEETESLFDEEDWYRVIRNCFELEDVIREQYSLIAEGVAGYPEAENPICEENKKPECALMVGEWGNWHGSSFSSIPALYQQCTMRDALTTALTLDIFHRNCNYVELACVAQTANVLNSLFLTEGDKFLKTPNFDVFKMYKVHQGAEALKCDYSMEKVDAEQILYTFASTKEDEIYVNVINIDFHKEHHIEMVFDVDVCYKESMLIYSQNPRDCNTFDHPDRIRARRGDVPEEIQRGYRAVVPSASVNLYVFKEQIYAV